ncbi:uncharacterized protein LOC143038556 isoform X2 [Oratosquilla oratoria]|uniref:uncharacterized protein LOC143038556 isoform X2 n=1 Tax=Oratosquilla oratoria TaxID=337810 RepID=UPI003F773868
MWPLCNKLDCGKAIDGGRGEQGERDRVGSGDGEGEAGCHGCLGERKWIRSPPRLSISAQDTSLPYISNGSAGAAITAGSTSAHLDLEDAGGPQDPSLSDTNNVSDVSRRRRTQLCRVVAGVASVGLAVITITTCREYIRAVLVWVETQDEWTVVVIFLGLFTLVSLPFTWGYLLVNVAVGYMFGPLHGVAVTICTVTIGVLISHAIVRLCLKQMLSRRLQSWRLGRALLTVLAGPQAFRVVVVTRLTPFPFGLQNALFSVSRVSTWLYLLATVIGLLPTQVLNCYLGSTMRSMTTVLTDGPSSLATWLVFGGQAVVSVVLMLWVLRRARRELLKSVMISPAPSPAPSSRAHAPTTPCPPLMPVSGHGDSPCRPLLVSGSPNPLSGKVVCVGPSVAVRILPPVFCSVYCTARCLCQHAASPGSQHHQARLSWLNKHMVHP